MLCTRRSDLARFRRLAACLCLAVGGFVLWIFLFPVCLGVGMNSVIVKNGLKTGEGLTSLVSFLTVWEAIQFIDGDKRRNLFVAFELDSRFHVYDGDQ